MSGEEFTFVIRPMRKQDYDNALALWQSLPGLGLSGADKETEIHHFLEENPSTCFVATENRAIIGTVLGGSDGRRGYIYHLAVDSKHQKSGLGRKLVDQCLAAFKVRGLQKCHIFVIKDNMEGMRFWEHIGWKMRDDILVMSKDL
jgi:ribosomal protein S18 acetylase RimI-like enzyme